MGSGWRGGVEEGGGRRRRERSPVEGKDDNLVATDTPRTM